jgi:hypothetical protein
MKVWTNSTKIANVFCSFVYEERKNVYVCKEYTTEVRDLLRAFCRVSFLSLLLFLCPMNLAIVVGKFNPHMNSLPSP